MKSFQILSDPSGIYKKMLSDIAGAVKSVYLETYIYRNDLIGREFRDALVKKAKEGVKVFVVVDAWGSFRLSRSFFDPLIEAGGKVRFYRKIRYTFPIFLINQERNHRKMTIVDDSIAYLGSYNISSDFLGWRELALRLEGDIAAHFSESFMNEWGPGKIKRLITHKKFVLISDVPRKHESERKFISIIRNSKKDILIETPYFVPPLRIRRALKDAILRGVEVKLILPHISDVRMADILRNRYLGALHRRGVKIFYYLPRTLHSKLFIADDMFILGSSNIDYRSFIQHYEVNLLGKDKRLLRALREYYGHELKDCRPFDYMEWKGRSRIGVIFEILLERIKTFI